ncbi:MULTISPECIES: hypothetical protein [Thermomonosporaceae]|uniref:hypothetical protein n=1 Tax=Thermomonosporaceae TaxID=2012 RepID=UPI00255A91D8|nr:MULTISPECIES: hypothetical protein [Thermomonosporaceae]MDL4777271.1 hypothetical protein [Actinomadura xylanilytica]
MAGTALRRRHGQAGLLVALLVVAGLVFSYGLGHAPPMRVCTEHYVTVPSGVAEALSHHGDEAGPAAVAAPDGGPAAIRGAWAAPSDSPLSGPLYACLSMAVLLTLMVLALAAAPRRSGLRFPARRGRAPAPRTGGAPPLPSLSSLQVLRL